MNSAREILYPGESLLGCSIYKGMNMETVTKVLAQALEYVLQGQSLDSIDLKQYGITCPEDKQSLLAMLLQIMLRDMQVLSQRVTQVSNFNNNVKDTVGTITDEKVKVTKDSTESKYLVDAIGGTNGRVKVAGDKIIVTGLTPVGARMMISPKRLPDFDTSSKGKVGTDLEGWAIRNGTNGLDNALGFFPAYTDTLDNAGKKAGSNTITLTKDNIASFDLEITGTINESLSDTIKATTPLGTLRKCFGTGGCRDVYVPGGTPSNVDSQPLPLKHTHSFTLAASHENPEVDPVTIIPEHIKEIPIEFIGF